MSTQDDLAKAPKRRGRRWTKDELDLLRATYPQSLCYATLESLFPGRGYETIRKRASIEGIRTLNYKKPHRWTPEEEALLSKLFRAKKRPSQKIMSARLKRSTSSIHDKLQGLGLLKRTTPTPTNIVDQREEKAFVRQCQASHQAYVRAVERANDGSRWEQRIMPAGTRR